MKMEKFLDMELINKIKRVGIFQTNHGSRNNIKLTKEY